MIAARLELTSPAAKRPEISYASLPGPDAVAKWSARKVEGFARRLGVSRYAVDFDITTKTPKA